MHVPLQVCVAPVGFSTGDDGCLAVESIEPSDDDEDASFISSVDTCLTTTVPGPQRQWLRQYSISDPSKGL